MKSCAVFLALGTVVMSPAIAQEHNNPATTGSTQQQGMMMQGGMMQGDSMMQGGRNGMMGKGNMSGMHVMAVTVTALDPKSGLVDAVASGLTLKLHFPPSSLAGVKVGDKLSVHLGFTKS
jgi:hypothetical protein